MSISYSIIGENSEGDSVRIQNYLSSIASPPFLLLENMPEISFPVTFHPSEIPDICFIFEDTLLSCIDTVIDDINAISPFTSIMILSKNEDRVFEAYAKNIVYFIRYSHLEEDLQAAITKYLYYLHILRPSYVSVTNSKVISVPYETSVYKGYKQDKIEMRGDRAEMSDFPLYLNTVAGGLDRRDQTIGGFSFVVKIYALPVVEIIG